MVNEEAVTLLISWGRGVVFRVNLTDSNYVIKNMA